MHNGHAAGGVDTRWFQERLADKRMSQRGLARLMGVDAGAMSLMLRGKRKMSVREAGEIARLLGVEASEVLARAGGVMLPAARDRADAGMSAAGVAGVMAAGGRERAVKAVDRSDRAVAPRGSSGEVEMPVPLPGGRVARLVLPEGLSTGDADRIAAVVRAFVVS